MNRAVVTVATDRYVKGALRLADRLVGMGEQHRYWLDCLPPGTPPHKEVPYAFKATALRNVSRRFSTLLWADACIYPVKPLTELWERIERDGAWIARNGWMNSEWTASSAYEALGVTREENAQIPHVVATAFGLSLEHPKGRQLLDEYCRLGLETNAFQGPWTNRAPNLCGDASVMGHRHDQTALSVVAWRLGIPLEEEGLLSYGKVGDDDINPRTILLADGSY